MYTLVVLALSTGVRRGKLLDLRWEQIDLARVAAYLEHTKNEDCLAVNDETS